MNKKKIRTYEDLIFEQQRLVSLLKTQEQVVKDDIVGVKKGLEPLGRTLQIVNKLATRDNTAPVMNFGLEMGIDLLIRRVLLAKSGWFTKIVIPFLVKNYSSHIIGEDKRTALIQKVKGFFRKIRPHAAPQPQPNQQDY